MANFDISMDEFDFDERNFLSDEAVSKWAEAEMKDTVAVIKAKLNKGKRANNSSLPAYSDSYKQAIKIAWTGGTLNELSRRSEVSRGPRKGSSRRLRKKVGRSSPSNLRVTGDLHESMQVSILRREIGAKATIQGHEAKKARGLMDAGYKGWFAFGADNKKRIRATYKKLLERHLARSISVKTK